MNKAQIAKVSLIERSNKEKGNKLINLVILETTNGRTPITRTLKEFVNDLDGSYLLQGVKDVAYITTVKHPAIQFAASLMKGATVEGDFRYVKAGEKYEVTKNSLVITDKTHPEYGTYNVGDMRARAKDGTIVEGFLDIELSMLKQSMLLQANALAQKTAELMGAFDEVGATDSSASGSDDNVNDIIDEIEDKTLKEAFNQSSEEPEEGEEPEKTKKTEKVK